MSLMLICAIAPGALRRLKALRLRHLEYIDAHKHLVLFGGPARAADGTPEMMVIVLVSDDRAAAEAFIATEPYNASGEVFSSVTIRPWSQVLPEPQPRALADAIAQERAQLGRP